MANIDPDNLNRLIDTVNRLQDILESWQPLIEDYTRSRNNKSGVHLIMGIQPVKLRHVEEIPDWWLSPEERQRLTS